jgi:hypothetical protein
MFYGIQIRAHDWPRNTSHGFALEVGGYCSGQVRSSYTDSVTSCQLESELHREWQQQSQHDIRRVTGVMRRRVEAVIQAHVVLMNI